jgi:hypothetical protein
MPFRPQIDMFQSHEIRWFLLGESEDSGEAHVRRRVPWHVGDSSYVVNFRFSVASIFDTRCPATICVGPQEARLPAAWADPFCLTSRYQIC